MIFFLIFRRAVCILLRTLRIILHRVCSMRQQITLSKVCIILNPFTVRSMCKQILFLYAVRVRCGAFTILLAHNHQCRLKPQLPVSKIQLYFRIFSACLVIFIPKITPVPYKAFSAVLRRINTAMINRSCFVCLPPSCQNIKAVFFLQTKNTSSKRCP